MMRMSSELYSLCLKEPIHACNMLHACIKYCTHTHQTCVDVSSMLCTCIKHVVRMHCCVHDTMHVSSVIP